MSDAISEIRQLPDNQIFPSPFMSPPWDLFKMLKIYSRFFNTAGQNASIHHAFPASIRIPAACNDIIVKLDMNTPFWVHGPVFGESPPANFRYMCRRTAVAAAEICAVTSIGLGSLNIMLIVASKVIYDANSTTIIHVIFRFGRRRHQYLWVQTEPEAVKLSTDPMFPVDADGITRLFCDMQQRDADYGRVHKGISLSSHSLPSSLSLLFGSFVHSLMPAQNRQNRQNYRVEVRDTTVDKLGLRAGETGVWGADEVALAETKSQL
ncbi:hypothetical protein C8J56DRAFT_1019587 [Mycena floridula]|nr:hypothetical protein C8J56DRAFT_1019587 [Mycena floridula]